MMHDQPTPFEPELDWTCFRLYSHTEVCLAHLGDHFGYITWSPTGYHFTLYDCTTAQCIAEDTVPERESAMWSIEQMLGLA